MEKIGIHKRDILVDRIGEAADSQEQAKEQFKDALEQFGSVVNFENGDLQSTYNKMSAEFESSKASAKNVSKRINSIESVSEDLFDEWEEELERYQSQKLRKLSETQLMQTRRQYKDLISSMRQAERKMSPVLEVFEDQELFLKHNLNARAVASLKSEYQSISADVAQLVEEMETSINQANEFIKSLEQVT
jgi:hypothetical protein